MLIGASAQGLFDLVKTPLGITIPGVEVHANVIENILDQSYLVRNPNTYIFELIFSIIIGRELGLSCVGGTTADTPSINDI